MTGIFAFGTNNDTVGAGIGHRRTFKNDLYRFSAVAAYADVHTTFYVRDFPFDFTMDGNFFYSNLKRRIVGSNFFVGLSASGCQCNHRFRFPARRSIRFWHPGFLISKRWSCRQYYLRRAR